MKAIDSRFNKVLFCYIDSVVTHADGTKVIYFTNTNDQFKRDHKVSKDKLPKLHCYDQLKPGHYYIVHLEHYMHRNSRRWLWKRCVMLRDKDMMMKTYKVFAATNDIKKAVDLGGVSRYYNSINKAKRRNKQNDYFNQLTY